MAATLRDKRRQAGGDSRLAFGRKARGQTNNIGRALVIEINGDFQRPDCFGIGRQRCVNSCPQQAAIMRDLFWRYSQRIGNDIPACFVDRTALDRQSVGIGP